MNLFFAYCAFIWNRSTKNGRALRAEVLKLMPRKEKANATGN